MATIAINGFGRIGRSFFREAFGLAEFDIVAVNDLTDIATLCYLLKYDSVYRKYGKNVESGEGKIMVDGKEIKVFAQKDPAKLPWKDLGIDIVVESTGFFADGEKASAHLAAGAKRVVITAPAKGDVTTALIGVNDDRFAASGPMTCNASCTTNSVAPVMAILHETLGVQKASMTTVHAYTATQKLVDGPDVKDMRRGRAAAVNIVPSSTGAAEAVIQAIPELKGKFDAVSVRVPSITGSLSVITALVNKTITVGEINALFASASKEPRWQKVLKVTVDEVVSSDIIGEPYGAIVDVKLTKVTDGNLVSVFSWYDNEAGYTATLIEHVKRVARFL
ncbi:MAG: type I glyceraldehyde-3-phosphate dehydrogenase [Candidatus Sungbacteria bacterium]|uniref:Type I glyceraldehyde-3-phosphate dehydrogenase n=1 Tax=Candidatus Sungiibacteriota bacterium TaxID=2750080 RepID=A0A932QY25_9BACT|nr:type I glyceraldehyde-3-phosphate dehydrogenase [Candidatus Sungbacteria bacterium]